jgi:hypothetical protein
VINLLLVLTSTQLYTPTATALTNSHPFTAAIMEQTDLIPPFLQVWIIPPQGLSQSLSLSCPWICTFRSLSSSCAWLCAGRCFLLDDIHFC